jgi:phosphoribosylamine--glycine ligase
MIEPTLRGAATEGFEFRGVLFLGLMMTDAGAKLLEYNVRFGDPEAQAILVRLKTDLVEICEAIQEQRLGEIKVEFTDEASACIVLASRGYPQRAVTGDIISGLHAANGRENVHVFHGGTALNAAGEFVTAGGRVLGVTATAPDLPTALQRSYAAVSEISWDGMQFRRDIGI